MSLFNNILRWFGAELTRFASHMRSPVPHLTHTSASTPPLPTPTPSTNGYTWLEFFVRCCHKWLQLQSTFTECLSLGVRSVGHSKFGGTCYQELRRLDVSFVCRSDILHMSGTFGWPTLHLWAVEPRAPALFNFYSFSDRCLWRAVTLYKETPKSCLTIHRAEVSRPPHGCFALKIF